MILRRLCVLLLMLCPCVAAANAAEPVWLRDPAIAPDGAHIAFRTQGQLWIVPAEGGVATPLTPAGAHASSPVWSPDSRTIAFASNRFGPTNVFAVPAEGGAARRLTWGSGAEYPSGFTADGAAVLYTAGLLGDAVQTYAGADFGEPHSQLYQVPLAGGRETMVLPNAAMLAHWNADGTALLYTSAAIEQPYRRHQVSDTVRQVWRYDPATGAHTRLTAERTESRGAVWAPDGTVLFEAERSGSLNIWRMQADGSAPQQLTFLQGEPVRLLSVSSAGDIVFGQAGRIWRMRPGQAPVAVPVQIGTARFDAESDQRTAMFTDFAVSPTGREVALVALGDLYVASIDGRLTRRLTATPGEERSPLFTPDGRGLIYTAERDGHWQLFEQRLADGETSFFDAGPLTETRLRTGPDDPLLPVLSPDGRKLAFTVNRDAVRVRDLADGHEVEVLPPGQLYLYADGQTLLSWSPDSQYLGLLVQAESLIDNVAVVPADGHLPAIRVQPSGEEQFGASWSADGGVLSWLSDADALHTPFGSDAEVDVRAAFTSRAARDVFRRRFRVPLNPDGSPLTPPGAKPDAAGKPMSLEPDGFEARPLPLPGHHGAIVFASLLPDGVSLLEVEALAAVGSPVRQLTATSVDLRTNRKRVVFSGVPYARGPVRANKAMTRLYFIGPAGLVEANLVANTSRVIAVAVDAAHDDAAVRAAAFAQFWSLTKAKYYDPGFAGVDWEALRHTMEARLPALGDAQDLAELLSDMAGALNASHTGSYYRASVPLQQVSGALGAYYDERYPGPGMKLAEIIAAGPLDAADTALRPGDVILAVNGVDIPQQGGIRRALRGTIGAITAITFVHPDAPAVRITEQRVPTTPAQEQLLALRRFVVRNRALVAARSCGRLGYVFLPAMDQANYRAVFSDVFGRFGQAEGLVVDERNNPGGDLHNNLVTLLSGQRYAAFAPPRGGQGLAEPRDRWTGRSVVVMNAASYSDGSVFPYAYRRLGLGQLVGETVAGTGTAVWWVESGLLPGLVYGLPQLPMRDADGALLENRDIKPDVAVPNDPQAWARGEDPQLLAAVHVLAPENCAPRE